MVGGQRVGRWRSAGHKFSRSLAARFLSFHPLTDATHPLLQARLREREAAASAAERDAVGLRRVEKTPKTSNPFKNLKPKKNT